MIGFLKKSLIVSTDLKLLRGLKMFLEETIVFLMICSCILRINIVSLMQMGLVTVHFYIKSHYSFNMILVSYTFLLGSQLILILSNMTSQTNPMKLPQDIQSNFIEGETYYIPWISNFKNYMVDQKFSEWIYFF